MLKIDMYLKRYGLKIEEIKKVDLTKVYYQYRPGVDYDRILTNSPHFELAQHYYNKGLKWLNANFKNTKYFIFQKDILKITPYVPVKKMRLFDSLKKGYLGKGYENDRIVILNDPFICTRYALNLSLPSPEVFMGHHRAGAMLALGQKNVEVIVAVDDMIGTKNCYGRLHDIYSLEKVQKMRYNL